jgi:RHS repeat-associated protein
MHVHSTHRYRLVAPALIAALLTSAAIGAPAHATPAQPARSLLTPDRAPRADVLGTVNRTPGIGGAPIKSLTASDGVRPTSGIAKPGIGLQKWYPTELRQLADRLQLLVNTANGNVIVRYNDLRVSGIGFGTDVSHVYNNMSEGSGSFGRGWTMSTGKDVGLEVLSDKVILHGPTGYTSTFTRNSNGTYKADSGINADLAKNSDGSFNLKWDDSEDTWVFQSSGSLREMRTNNDVKIKINYDATNADRLAAIYDPNGRVTTMSEYDSANRIVRMTDQTGGMYGPFTYDGSGNLTSFPDRLGNQIAFAYDGSGNLTSITDPNGDVYTLTYDSSRRIKTISEPADGGPAVTTYDYPASGRTTEKDPRGNTSTYYFDSEGRQTRAIDPEGHEQDKTWTANSDVASTTNGLGKNITYGFDGANNPTSATLPTGAKTVAGYTDATHPSFPTSMTDPQGNKLQNTYGANGDLLSTKSMTLNKDLYTYEHNSQGQVTKSTDPDGRVTTYQYDGGGRLTTEFPPGALDERSYTYDDKDRITDTRDGNQVKLHYRYDALDRLVEVQRVDGTTYTPIQYINYDANGNLINRSFADSYAEFLYNPRNQVNEARNTRGSLRYNVYYRYDLNNNLTRIQDDGGLVDYQYDKANRLTYQSAPQSQMWAQFSYDDADNRTLTRYSSDLRVTAEYDDSDRQTKLVATGPDGTKPINRTYKWNDAKGDTSLLQSETREGTTIGYKYDERNRLLTAGSNSYQLDGASNLKAAEGRTFTINTAGQVSASGGVTYTHDGNGNLASGSGGELAATYSPTNQLASQATQGAATVSFTYQSTDQTQRAVIQTGARQQVLTNTAIGVTGVVTDGRRSNFIRDSAGTLIGQFTEGGEPLFAVTDYQGSTLLLVDASNAEAARYDYTPYGTTTKTGRAADGNPFRWNGQWQIDDAHGTYLVGHRQHDPKLARFTQTDPSGQELNPYTYALANPVSLSDPTGLITWAQIGGIIIIAAAAGVAAGLIGGIVGGTFGPVGATIGAVSASGAAIGCVGSGLWVRADGGSGADAWKACGIGAAIGSGVDLVRLGYNAMTGN